MTPTIDTLPATPDIAPLPTVDGGFQTVLADPPWRFANRTGKVAPEHRRLDRYGTMDLEAIKALPVGDVTAKDAHLYLWVPNALLLEGIEVLQAWGFRYVSNVIWAKRRKDGGPDGRGVGFYFRNVTEPILFGVKGSMRTLAPARSTVNMIETRKREHSRKPDEQYDLIESCSPGPYLEMFARYARPGWSAWGNESDDEVAPKGQTHKGYSGGAIETFPSLEPNQRLSPWLADRLSRILVEEYADGASIDQLAQESGYSIQRVRGLLEQGGVTLRGRGRPKKEEVPVKAARKTQRAAPGSRRGDENRGPGSKCRSTGSRAVPREPRDGGGRVRCPTARRPTVGCSRWPPRSGVSDRSAEPPGRQPCGPGCPGARSSGSGTPRRRRPSAGTARRGA